MRKTRERVSCNRCQMLSINGLACHETGCPNANKRWIDGEWVKGYECPECGEEHTDPDDAANCCNGESGQDHESYTDDQDHESYVVDPEWGN